MSHEKIKHFKSHLLLTISNPIKKDPVLITCMQKVFVWANEMGLKGHRVDDLTLVDPNEKGYHPLNQTMTLWCKIECSEEEEKMYKETLKNQITHNIKSQLEADE